MLIRNLVLKNLDLSLDAFYQKTFYAAYRFKYRIFNAKLPYVPSIFGDENLEKLQENIENQLIRRSLKIGSHPEDPHFPEEYSSDGPPVGVIYAKYPFKFRVEKGKIYTWCTCGYSSNQPFCDASHRTYWTTKFSKKTPKYRPLKYIADETKDVWFCNCKQTSTRPLCDGTHKTDKVKNYQVKVE